MTDGRRLLLLILGAILAVAAAGAVFGAVPRSFSGSGGGDWVASHDNLPFAAVIGAFAVLHLWTARSDSAAARLVAIGIGVLGILLGLVLLGAAPPAGIATVLAYGFLLSGLVGQPRDRIDKESSSSVR